MSGQWRQRFVTSTHNLMVESMWELENIDEGRVANPIEYMQMRRRVGGAPWSANLVEFAAGAEVPARFAATRPLRVLADTFADAVHLRNDLFSYQKEIQFEGERHNLVLVVEHFLDVDRWAAAKVVARLMAMRMKQFDHLAAVGLPALFAEHDLARPAREALRRHVAAMRDWMSAVLEWHRQTTRYTDSELRRTHLGFTLYPTGVGISAARIPMPVR